MMSFFIMYYRLPPNNAANIAAPAAAASPAIIRTGIRSPNELGLQIDDIIDIWSKSQSHDLTDQ